MKNFPSTLFRVLRQIDREAVPNKNGSPTGLNWYGGFFEPDKKRPRSEVCWSQRLAELLPEHGYPTRAEVPYPNLPRCKCDNVVTMPDGATLWLENKGAWKDYWSKQGNLITYRSYLLHPLVPGLDKSKEHTVPLDLKKLESVRQPVADYVGLLLVGFDRSDNPMASDVDELVGLAKLGVSPWTATADHWADPHRPGNGVHCWFWCRPAIESPGSDTPL